MEVEQEVILKKIAIGTLVLVDRKLSFCEKWDIIDRIKLKLARNKIPNYIILKSDFELFENKNNIGSVVYYAIKEGKEI